VVLVEVVAVMGQRLRQTRLRAVAVVAEAVVMAMVVMAVQELFWSDLG